MRLTPKFSVEAPAASTRRASTPTRSSTASAFSARSTSKTTGYSVAGQPRVTPLTTVVVRYERIDDEFRLSPLRDSHSFRVHARRRVQAARARSRAAPTSATAGSPRRPPDVLPEFSGLVAQLGLSYTLLGSTTFGVSYRAGPDLLVRRACGRSSSTLGGRLGPPGARPPFRRAGLGRPSRVTTTADLLARPTVDLASPIARIDTTWNYAGSIGYRIGNGRVGFGVSLLGARIDQRSFRDYDNLRFGTTVTYGF